MITKLAHLNSFNIKKKLEKLINEIIIKILTINNITSVIRNFYTNDLTLS